MQENKTLTLIGRTLLALMFLLDGLGKITGFDQNAGFMATQGLPATRFLLAGAIIFLLAGWSSVTLGYKARVGAILLVLFMIPTTLIFHNFWAAAADQRTMQMINFLKNTSMIGGLLLIVARGAGGYSLDARRETSTARTTLARRAA